MKIKFIEGCTDDSLYVDDVDVFEKYSAEQKKELIKKIIDSINEEEKVVYLNNTLHDLLSMYGTEIESDYCDQCGSYNITYEMDI